MTKESHLRDKPAILVLKANKQNWSFVSVPTSQSPMVFTKLILFLFPSFTHEISFTVF